MELFDSSEARKNVENVLNRETMEALYTLSDEGVFDLLYGFVKDGKESKVAVAERGDELLAVKLYVIEASNYRDMRQYLTGDPRFRDVKPDRRTIVHEWCTKEFRNLQLAEDAGVPVPHPIAAEKNVLIMAFLGEDFRPAPRLQDVDLENPGTALDRLTGHMATLWQDADMVHGDLSAFNVLLWEERLRPIDFSQAVLTRHPRAGELLERDVHNVAEHFRRRYGMDVDEDEMLDRIRGGADV